MAYTTLNSMINKTNRNICAPIHLFLSIIYMVDKGFLFRWMMNLTAKPIPAEESFMVVACQKALSCIPLGWPPS